MRVPKTASACLAAVAVSLALVAGPCGAQMPSVMSDADGNVTVRGTDVAAMVTDPSTGGTTRVSMRDLAADVEALKAATAALQNASANFPTTLEVVNMVDAAVANAIRQATLLINGNVAPLTQRVAANEAALAGLPQTRAVIADLVSNVDYLVAHANNVTTCAVGGNVHAGNGTCVDPVPQCPRPAAPSGGTVSLSSNYIIPGVTATYSCPGQGAFVAGQSVRTCNETTGDFDGTAPRCLQCAVSNCLQCVNTVNTCARCATGYDLAAEASCVARAITVVVMGGQVFGSRHNYNQIQMLPPNSNQFALRGPYPPISASRGSATIIRGDIYLVGSGGHPSLSGYYRLPNGAGSWTTFTGTNSFLDEAPFYATIDGVGAREDGFYRFGRSNSAVFQPAVTTSQWTALPAQSASTSRYEGATAVVGSAIYCLGGWAANAQASDRVSALVTVFNATTRTWSTGVPLTSGRRNLAAASYNGKIYVFGGRSAANTLMNTVEEFDPSTLRWTAKSAMPEAWEMMSSGEMPVFPDGTVMIPFSLKNQNTGIATSLVYNIRSNSWSQGPAPAIPLGRYTVAHGSLS